MKPGAVIIGVGGQTSIGHTMPAISAAVRAALNVFGASKTLVRRYSGEPAIIAMLDTLPAGGSVASRMTSMALAAAREALGAWTVAAASRVLPPRGLPILLALPPARPGFLQDTARRMAQDVIQGLPVKPDKPRCGLYSVGHAGGLTGLEKALRLIQDGAVSVCLVGGVDSYLDIDVLQGVESFGRLKGEEQPNGFIPGEGAGFILLASREYADRARLDPLAEIVASGSAVEPQPWYSGKPTLGQGLTGALQAIFRAEGLEKTRADVTYCDLNGESWRVDEWVYAYLRTGKRHGEPLDLRHPAACWGDVGAASGTLLAGLAAFEMARGREPIQTILVWTVSDMAPYRASCLLRRA